VVFDVVTVLIRNLALQLLDPLVLELNYSPRVQADHMIMVRSVREFEHGRATLEVVPDNQSRILELGQNAVDGSEPELLTRIQDGLVDAFRTQMTLRATLQDLEYPEPRRGHLQACVAEILPFHVLLALRVGYHARLIMTQTFGALQHA